MFVLLVGSCLLYDYRLTVACFGVGVLWICCNCDFVCFVNFNAVCFAIVYLLD